MHWLVVMFVSVCYLLNNSQTPQFREFGGTELYCIWWEAATYLHQYYIIHLRKKNNYVLELLTVVIIPFSMYKSLISFCSVES